MWLFITINVSSVSSCNTFEKSVKNRNSVACNLCHWKVYLKCNYLRYVEYQYIKYSRKWPIILWYRFLRKLSCDSLSSPKKNITFVHLFSEFNNSMSDPNSNLENLISCKYYFFNQINNLQTGNGKTPLSLFNLNKCFIAFFMIFNTQFNQQTLIFMPLLFQNQKSKY